MRGRCAELASQIEDAAISMQNNNDAPQHAVTNPRHITVASLPPVNPVRTCRTVRTVRTTSSVQRFQLVALTKVVSPLGLERGKVSASVDEDDTTPRDDSGDADAREPSRIEMVASLATKLARAILDGDRALARQLARQVIARDDRVVV